LLQLPHQWRCVQSWTRLKKGLVKPLFDIT
jgi:hypothetical protein